MRVLLGKIGLDGHDIGVRLIARRLIESGAEVVYLGKRNTPENFAAAARQEDVTVIGVGSLTGGLADLVLELADLLQQEQCDTPIVAGGILESGDADRLRKRGISVFGPGDALDDVVSEIIRVGSAR